MGKIAPVSAKYIIHAHIQIDGAVDRPDIVGAVFGQTEGLLGSDLELRELQRSGRIGRIEVNSEIKAGKTAGMIIVPSSLDKSETAIVASALETIQRIGPCNAKVGVEKIEDVRVAKRNYVLKRAEELLKGLNDDVDSQEMTEQVECSVRISDVIEYGPERLAAGPMIQESDEIIIVEGRADVINLLKAGFKNAIALNGTSVPESIKKLTKEKTVVAFVDGDRGGDLIIRELMQVADIDFVVKAPDGKEVEEITKKEIHKALRSRIPADKIKIEVKETMRKPMTTTRAPPTRTPYQRPENGRRTTGYQGRTPTRGPIRSGTRAPMRGAPRVIKARPSDDQKAKFKQMLEDLIGTRGAYLLDEKLNILGKVPITELTATIKSLGSGIFAVVFDGAISKDITLMAERANVKFIVGMESKLKPEEAKLTLLTGENL